MLPSNLLLLPLNAFQRFVSLVAGTFIFTTLTEPSCGLETLVWTPVPVEATDAIRDLRCDGHRIVRIIEESDGAPWVITGYRIESSTDGVSWTAHQVTGFDQAREASVFHAAGIWFVTVGGLRFTSDDGVLWTEANATLPDAEAEVPSHWIFANGWHVHAAKKLYGIATTDRSSRLRSQDGNEWVRIEQEFGNALAESFGAGHFVVLSRDTRYTSSNGETWSTAPVSGLPYDPIDLVYYRGRWLCHTDDGEGSTLYVSDDACRWQAIQSWTGSVSFLHHQQLDRLFVAENSPSLGGTNSNNYFSSSNGFRWTTIGSINLNSLHKNGPVALRDQVYAAGSTTQSLSLGNPTRYGIIRPGALEWPTTAGMEYRVECSPDLSVDSWKALGGWRTSAPRESALFLLRNPEDLGARQFYRILSRPIGN